MIFFDFEDGFWYAKLGEKYEKFETQDEAQLALDTYMQKLVDQGYSTL